MAISFHKHCALTVVSWLLAAGLSCDLSAASPAPAKVDSGGTTKKSGARAASKSTSKPKREKQPDQSIEKDLMSDSETEGRRHSKKGGQRGSHHGDMPSFRNVKHLESLTAVQSARVNQILSDYKKVMIPMASKFRASREAQDASDEDNPGHGGKSRGNRALRMQMRKIKMEAWEKIQKILTPAQKEELGKMRRDDRGPRRRNNPEALPAARDSGKSFSK